MISTHRDTTHTRTHTYSHAHLPLLPPPLPTQVLVDGDDMANGSTEGDWIECTSSDLVVQSDLPLGRLREQVLNPECSSHYTQC